MRQLLKLGHVVSDVDVSSVLLLFLVLFNGQNKKVSAKVVGLRSSGTRISFLVVAHDSCIKPTTRITNLLINKKYCTAASQATMVSQYLFVFAQVHDEFRIPELLSISELYDIEITFPADPQHLDVSRPFMVLGLQSEEDARTLAKRCILIRYAVIFIWYTTYILITFV